MNKRDEFVEQLKIRLDKWSAEIDEMEAKARKAGADARLEAQKRVDVLKRKRDDARDRLEDLRRATGDAWVTLREGADRVWADLAATFREAKDDLEQAGRPGPGSDRGR